MSNTLNTYADFHKKISKGLGSFILVFSLAACSPEESPVSTGSGQDDIAAGGDVDFGSVGGDSGGGSISLQPPKSFSMSPAGVKIFRFEWEDSPNATRYRLYQNVEGNSGSILILDNIPQGQQRVDVETVLYRAQHSFYLLEACSGSNCSALSNPVFVQDNKEELLKTVGFIKASNADAGDSFSGLFDDVDEDEIPDSIKDIMPAMSLSADGRTLVVGAPLESSDSKSITHLTTSAQLANDDLADSGAVYVFTKTTSGWEQQAVIKASNSGAADRFGNSVSVSADGNTLVVGSYREDGTEAGVSAGETSAPGLNVENSGAAYVFTRSGGIWSQHSYIKAPHPGRLDFFGYSVAVSDDGDRLVVGSPFEDSNHRGVAAPDIATNNLRIQSGAAYVYELINNVWTEQAFLKASNAESEDRFGWAVSLSGDGMTIAVGAKDESSASTGVNSERTGQLNDAGAAYVFAFESGTWVEQAYIKSADPSADDDFGDQLDLDYDGNTLVVGASGEDSSSTDPNVINNNSSASGAAYVFIRIGTQWVDAKFLKPDNIDSTDFFGQTVSISGDGNVIAVGAPREGSTEEFFNTDSAGDVDNFRGAVFVFERRGDDWVQKNFVKASNPRNQDRFGEAVSLSYDASTLAVGALNNSNEFTDDSTSEVFTKSKSGAVYLY